MIGGGTSVSIETMQFFLKRGFSEVDDVMHNKMGCLIGYGIYKLLKFHGLGFMVREVLREVWDLTLSTANATRQTLSELSLLSLLWQFL